jgi:tetratricopeptide (TPR) repeat protein
MDPPEYQTNINEALRYYNNEEFENGLRLIDEVIAAHPASATAHYIRAALLHGQKQVDPALASIDRAIELEPNKLQFKYYRAVIEYNFKKYDEAIASVDRLLSIDPYDRDAQKIKMLSQYHTGDFRGALDTIRQIGVNTRYYQEDKNLADYRKKVVDMLGGEIEPCVVVPGDATRPGASSSVPDLIVLVKNRLARGEIGEAEYLRLVGLIC